MQEGSRTVHVHKCKIHVYSLYDNKIPFHNGILIYTVYIPIPRYDFNINAICSPSETKSALPSLFMYLSVCLYFVFVGGYTFSVKMRWLLENVRTD